MFTHPLYVWLGLIHNTFIQIYKQENDTLSKWNAILQREKIKNIFALRFCVSHRKTIFWGRGSRGATGIFQQFSSFCCWTRKTDELVYTLHVQSSVGVKLFIGYHQHHNRASTNFVWITTHGSFFLNLLSVGGLF